LIAWRIGGAGERRQQRENADPLASNRTLLVWLRSSLACAGLGFAVAESGQDSR
jgi:uncharacterized membrane protein YidH (DUF202 family)